MIYDLNTLFSATVKSGYSHSDWALRNKNRSVACLHPQLDELHRVHWADLRVPGLWRMLLAKKTSHWENYHKCKSPQRPRAKSVISKAA